MVARISDEDGPQFPVVGEDLPCLAAWDVVASRVEAVRPLEFIDQRNRVVGNSFRLPCSDSDDSDDDVVLVGVVRPLTSAAPLGGTEMLDDWTSENRHEMCCAWLDDFNWVVPPYDPDIIVPGRELDVEIPDVDREICVLPDEFPVVVDI